MELNKEQLDLLSAIGKDDYECELHYCKIQDLDFLIKNGLSNNVGVGKHEITDKGIARLKEEEAKPTLDIPESLEDYFDWYDVLLMGEPDYKEDGVAVASEDYYYYFLRDPGDISVGIDSYDYSPSFINP